jgi:hypothetical protein
VRFATLLTTTGPRLHVRAEDGGYVDIGEATGEDRFARFGSFIAAGPAALEAARAVRSRVEASSRRGSSARRFPPRNGSSASA